MRSIGATLVSLGREAAQIVLPAWCVVCRKPLPLLQRVSSCCRECWLSLPRLESCCRRCAQPLSLRGDDGLTCLTCSSEPPPVDWIDSWGHYRSGLERLIHAFKFEHHDFLSAPMSELLVERFAGRGDFDFDAVVAVPMQRSKERRRGYNQAELLARAFSKRTSIPSTPSILRKVIDNEMQSTLPRTERAANVRDVFLADESARGLSILLIDDICTTGETLNACAAALLNRGARRVCALTLARA